MNQTERGLLMGVPKPTLMERLLPAGAWVSAPEAILAAVLVLAPLALGGVHLVVKLACAGALVIAWGWLTLQRSHSRRQVQLQSGPHRVEPIAPRPTFRFGMLGAVLCLLIGWGVFQWLPLSLELVETLSPQAAQLRLAAAAAVGADAPTWAPLSMDAGATAASLVALLGMLAAYLLAANLGRSQGFERVVVYIEVAALAVLAAGLVHAVIGASQIYGFYQASVDLDGRTLLLPFVNLNHGAALFLLGAVLAMGQWLGARKPATRHLLTASLLAMGVVVTLSRANTVLLAVAVVALAARGGFTRDNPALRARSIRLLVGTACLGLLAVMLIGPSAWLAEFEGLSRTDAPSDFAKLLEFVWGAGWDLSSQFPIVGVGLGAMDGPVAAVMGHWDVGLVSHAHNAAIQALVDLGWPVAVLVVAGVLGWLIAALWRTWGRISELAIVVAVGCLILQNMADFSLWVYGVGIPAMVAAGLVSSATSAGADKGDRRHRLARVRWPFAATIIMAGLLIVTGLQSFSQQPHLRHEALAAAMEGSGTVDLKAAAQDAPADYFTFVAAAKLANGGTAPDLVRESALLAQAARLAPLQPGLLLARGQLLARTGDVSGAAEAFTSLADQGNAGVRDALDGVIATNDRAIIRKFFTARQDLIVRGANFLYHAQRHDDAERLLAWGIEREPDNSELLEELGHLWAQRSDRQEQLNRLVAQALGKAGAEPPLPDAARWERLGYLLQGYLFHRDRRYIQAWHSFKAAAELDEERAVRPLLQAGKAAVVAQRFDLLELVVADLDKQKIQGGWPNGEYRLLRSQAREAKGDLRGAIREMNHALHHLNHVPGYHDRLALLLKLNGDAVASERVSKRAQALRDKATP